MDTLGFNLKRKINKFQNIRDRTSIKNKEEKKLKFGEKDNTLENNGKLYRKLGEESTKHPAWQVELYFMQSNMGRLLLI